MPQCKKKTSQFKKEETPQCDVSTIFMNITILTNYTPANS